MGKFYTMENWSIGQVIAKRDNKGRFVKGHRHLPKEVCKKISKSCLGHKRNKGKNHPLYGKHCSRKTKRKISIARKGKSNFCGKHHTEETKKKISLLLLGREFTEESKKKMSIIRTKFWENRRMRK